MAESWTPDNPRGKAGRPPDPPPRADDYLPAIDPAEQRSAASSAPAAVRGTPVGFPSGGTPHSLEEDSQLAPGNDFDPYKNPRPPGFFQGFFSEDNAYLSPVIAGLGQGAALVEQGLGTLVRGAGRIYMSVGQPRPVGAELPGIGRAIEADAHERVQKLTPNPATVGAAGQMVSSLASAAYRMGVGGALAGPAGAAGLVGTTAGRERYLELREQGVDEQTASALAQLTGIFQGAGALLPAGVGGTLLTRLSSGSVSNLGFGMVNRYADHQRLEDAGYHEMAAQQRVWDGQAMLADLLLGGTFGAVAHLQARGAAKSEAAATLRALDVRLGRGAPGAQDAGLALSLASRDESAAPGVAVNPAAAGAHAAALEQSQVDLELGRPVNVAGTGVEQSTFARREAVDLSPAQAMLMQALQEGGFGEDRAELARLEAAMGARLAGEKPEPEPAPTAATRAAGAPPTEGGARPAAVGAGGREWVIPRDERLTGEDAAIEGRFRDALQTNYEDMVTHYREIPDTQGGKVLSVDTARELSPDYLADRTRSQAVHEPASAFIKRLYTQMLAQPPKPGEEPTVLFMGGGTGAGKSTAIKQALGAVADHAQIVYDTNLNGTRSAISKIDQALAAGKHVSLAYVYRNPSEALTAGALKRATRQEGEFGSGRTVPIEEHVNTHVGSNQTIREVAAHYAGDERVTVELIDNSRGRGNSRPMQMADLPQIDYNRAREESHAALEAARAAGTISEATYRGFRGATAEPRPAAGAAAAEPATGAAGRAGTAAELRPGTGGQPQSQRPGGRPNQLADESPGKPAQPGQPFLILRAGEGGSLENRNGGNAQAIGAFLQRLEDHEGPQPAGRGEMPATIQVFQATAPEKFGAFKTVNRGQGAEAGTIGRSAGTGGAINYSVGKGVPHELVATITVSDLREALSDSTGFATFDEAGSRSIAQVLRALVKAEMTGAGEQPTHLVQTATGRQVEVRPKVVEAADLVTSDRPEYPGELQPRQRGARAALTEQVNKISRDLNPEMLGNAPEADRGAPIVGPDNVVESGNGRVFALRQAFQNQPQGATAYRKYLEDQGYDVSGLKEPVLVRERVTPMTPEERQAFTVEANQTSVAALSPVERAAADSRLLDSAVLSQLRNGEIASAQNAAFVRAFLTKVPDGERNALVNPDGTVSQEGVRRLQAAILGKAYGGTAESNAVLGRMLESTDTDMRSTMGAMLDAAPAFAKLRQAVADGKVGPEYDLSKALTQAVETAVRIRDSGQALGEFLKQADFLTRRLPVVDQLLRALYDKAGERLGGRDKVAQVLMNYADRALKQRLDQGMLFGDPPVRPEQLLAANEAGKPEAPELKPAADMFGLRRPAATAPDQVARQALERNPNLEIPTGVGDETTRARAELIAAEEGAEKTEERAPDALSIAANCFGQRAA